MTRSVTAAFFSAALSACAFQSAQAADTFPNRAVRMIIPFPVGGATDILARVVAQKSAELFGQQVVVDNRPGAGGTLGSRIAVTATADGYTLLMGTTSTHAIGPHLYAKPPYDSLTDFSPITQIATSPVWRAANVSTVCATRSRNASKPSSPGTRPTPQSSPERPHRVAASCQ